MSNVTNTTPSLTVQTALPRNNNRNGLILFNDTTGAALVKIGEGASASSYSMRLRPGDSWTASTQEDTPEDAITVIWSAASTGLFCATEF